MLTPPVVEDVIAEVCALLLAPRFECVSVRVEDGWTASPLVYIQVKVRFWQWPRFDPIDLEARLRSVLKLIARDRHYRVRIDPE